MSKVTATMAGNVWKLLVQIGDEIMEGDEVVILESMKMEIPITVEAGGRVKEIKKMEGEFVDEGEVLIVLE